MLFSTKKVLLGAACLLGFASAQDDCSNGPWQDLLSIGGQGGLPFCVTKWSSGVVMSGVEVWASGGSLTAIQFYYSDGTNSPLMGRIDGDRHARMDWDPATDGINQLKLWGNGRGQYTGRVYIRTKNNAVLDVGKDTNGQDTFEIAVGSGILLGAYGKSYDLIDSLGFLFLKSKVDRITIDDVTFKDTPEMLNARMQGLQTVIVDSADHTNNNSNSTETFTFTKSETKTTSKTFSTTNTESFGITTAIEISGEILDLGAKSTTTLAYGYSTAATVESSFSDSVLLTYSAATDLAPGQRTFCRAVAMSGQYKGEYTANVNIWLEDGTTFGFSQEGTMEQVNWSKATSSCQDTPFPDLPGVQMKRARKFLA